MKKDYTEELFGEFKEEEEYARSLRRIKLFRKGYK